LASADAENRNVSKAITAAVLNINCAPMCT
jgi:hypothetical protein